MRKLTVLSVGIVLVLGLSFATTVMASDEEEALKVVASFFDSMSAGDGELMSSLWLNSPLTTRFGPGERGTFIMQGGESIKKFWVSELSNSEVTATCSFHHAQATMLGNNIAIITGYNTEVDTDPTTNEQSVWQVRGTFVVQKINGKWLIVHEHSSVLPTE